MVNFTINGRNAAVEKGTTILNAAREVGVRIPTLCHDNRMKPTGACRLCIVEVGGSAELPASCTTPVREGMVIETESRRVRAARKQVLELLWEDHPNECLTCEKAGECQLQDYCYLYGVEAEGYAPPRTRHAKDETNPFYVFDRDKCILCGKCVRMCEELQGVSAINFSQRGHETVITHPFGKGMENSACVSCGNCVAVCPTGALYEKTQTKFRAWDVEQRVRTTCGYCGVGCQMDLLVKDGRIVRVEGAEDGVNEGLLCVKGKFAYHFIEHPDRLTTPLIREGEGFREASWEEALDRVAQRMDAIRTSEGPNAIAGLVSARCTNEDNYVMQKLFRAVIGTNNLDHCARL